MLLLRVLFGAVIASVVIFFWGWAYWELIPKNINLPQQVDPWTSFPAENEEAIVSTLKNSLSQDGVYMYPPVDYSDESKEKHSLGPLVQLRYAAGGVDMPTTMRNGFAHMAVSALLCAILLAIAEPLCCYSLRVFFVFLVGVFAAVWVDGGLPIWWNYPWNYALYFGIYHASAWLLAGIVLGAVVKRRRVEVEDSRK